MIHSICISSPLLSTMQRVWACTAQSNVTLRATGEEGQVALSNICVGFAPFSFKDGS